MEKLNKDRKILKNFGLTMAIAFGAISVLLFLRYKYTLALYGLIISLIFFCVGLISPALLKPIYIAWMRFVLILSWINTRIILVILFYLIFTPMGLLIRLLGIDLLERKNRQKSYWKEKEKIDFNPLNYERRF
ncbi:MAG: SxtJ family membrane protein [Candidatus Ratteibacteria bacterium]|nr:SxtJ family membrane protein [Candidatus Ratteibacteria bacterium]